MIRFLALSAISIASGLALNCFIAQSTNPYYIPNALDNGTCPVSTVSCFRTIINTTYEGFQVIGSRYGCDVSADSVCKNGVATSCQDWTMGTCCCQTADCNLADGLPPVFALNTTTAPPSKTTSAGTAGTTSPNEWTTNSSQTASTAIQPVPDHYTSYCYTGHSSDQSYQPSNWTEVGTCTAGTHSCYRITTNGELFYDCDNGNKLCLGHEDSKCRTVNGTQICCCDKDYCNGVNPPYSTHMSCYVGYNSDIRYVPLASDAQNCNDDVTFCFRRFINGNLYYGCDSNYLCMGKKNQECYDSVTYGRVCCCDGYQCNGNAFGDFQPKLNGAMSLLTMSSAIATVLLHNLL